MRPSLLLALLVPALASAGGVRKDLFEGAFGATLFSSREPILKTAHHPIGYRTTLQLPPLNGEWNHYRSTLQALLEKRLRSEGYRIILSKAILLDESLPSSCNIVAERDQKKLFVHCLAFGASPTANVIEYEVEDES